MQQEENITGQQRPGVPRGFHTISPYLIVKDIEPMLDFLQQGFTAQTKICQRDTQGLPLHAEALVGDSWIMLGKPDQHNQTTTFSQLYLYVADAKQQYQQLLAAGATSFSVPEMQPWGDLRAAVKDFAGNIWWIATRS